MTSHNAEEHTTTTPPEIARDTTFRARLFARGFRRLCSNLAWVMGGAVLASLCVSSSLEHRDALPDELGYLMIGLALSALLIVAVSALVSAVKGMEQWFSGIEVHGNESVELAGMKPKTLLLGEIQGVVSSGKNHWLVLRNGDLLELLFLHVKDAKRAEEALPPWLRTSPLEIMPTPSGARHPLGLFLVGSFVAGIGEELRSLPFTAFLTVLSLTMVSTAFWLRGRRLIVAQDGIRVGSRFYSLDKLTTFECTHSRVSWTHAGKERRAKIRLPEELAFALQHRVHALIQGEAPLDDALERREGDDVHAWLGRVTALVRGGDFRQPALSNERILAAAHGKSPLRVRVAVLAALKDDAPELVEGMGRESADPRFLRALEVVRDDDAWRKVVDALERRGDLETG
ncbi:MAG: hypothetical protein ACI9KE_004891 [Polyangiales bacterium]|jgi:hypothetical protein